MPARRRDPVSVPRTFHSSSRPYHHSHDYGIDESISRAGYFSNAVLDDTDAAAAYSRAKDYDLIRNTNSAIRQPTTDYGSSRASRSVSRYPSLPPVDRKLPLSRSSLSPTPSRSAIVPHKSLTDLRSALQSPPPPTSLLSSRINSYLRGDSLPLGVRPSTRSLVSYKSYLDSAAPRPPPPSHDSRSIVSYKSHLSDPAVTSPFSTRSSSRLYRGFVPSSSSSLPPYRFRSDSASSSLPRYNISLDDKEDDYDYGGSDGDEDEDEYDPPSYRRKYKILRGRQALPSRPSSTLYYTSGSRAGSDDDDYDDYSLVPEDRGTYSYNPRPLGVPPVTLSSFEGPHDGSYEADMAEMYDYVPFRPSRQGILELTQHRPSPSSIEILDADNDDDDDLDSSPSFLPSPSSSTLLTFPPAGASYSSPTIPSTSLYPKSSSDLTSSPYSPVSSYADNNVMFDSVLSNTAARARAALKDNQHLSDYRNASLVMSVEGSAVSPDGKNRYGFRYYPPPIALKGSGVGLDERILGVTPKPNTSPADSFFGDYLNRLKSLRSEINDREGSRAASCSPYSRGVVSVPRPMPSYAHSTVHMPVHIAGRSASVPVSSYRSHADDHGLSHRVDIFPLVESSTSLGKDKVQLPLYRAGGDTSKLTMLEKINIKAAIIGSKMEAEDGGKSKRKPRPLYHVEKSREPSAGSSQQSSIYSDAPVYSWGLQSSRPPLPKTTDRKSIRTVDGFTKPKNVMSWEHRIESRISPDDLIYQPQSMSRLREQLRGARDKADVHRQLIDRYLDTNTDKASAGSSNNASSTSSSAGTDPNNAPMSDLRRRLRRTLNKTRNSP